MTAQAQTSAHSLTRLTVVLAAIAGLILALFYVASPALAEHGVAGPAVAPSDTHEFGAHCPDGWEGSEVRFLGSEVATGESEGGVTLDSVGTSGNGSVDFTVDSPNVAVLVVLKGSEGSNIYDYSGLAAGGAAHDDGLEWVHQATDNQVIFCLAEAVPPSVPASIPASVPASVEGTQLGGTGTPVPSLPNTAFGLPGSGSLATIFFGAILIASLGALAYANVAAVRSRR